MVNIPVCLLSCIIFAKNLLMNFAGLTVATLLLFLCMESFAEHYASTAHAIQDGYAEAISYAENEPVSSSILYGSPHKLEPQAYPDVIPLTSTDSRDWMLLVLIVCLLLLAVSWYNFSARTAFSLKAFFAVRYFYQLDKEAMFFRDTPTYLLTANFLLVAALLSYQVMDYYNHLAFLSHYRPLLIFGVLLMAFILFYIIKAMLIKLLAGIFSTGKASFIYLENIFLSNIFLGLILLPLVFYNAFTPSLTNIYVMLALLLAINLYKLLRGSLLAYAASGFSVYYLFLYLCGVEFAPLLIIYKVLTMYLPAS